MEFSFPHPPLPPPANLGKLGSSDCPSIQPDESEKAGREGPQGVLNTGDTFASLPQVAATRRRIITGIPTTASLEQGRGRVVVYLCLLTSAVGFHCDFRGRPKRGPPASGGRTCLQRGQAFLNSSSTPLSYNTLMTETKPTEVSVR